MEPLESLLQTGRYIFSFLVCFKTDIAPVGLRWLMFLGFCRYRFAAIGAKNGKLNASAFTEVLLLIFLRDMLNSYQGSL